MAIGTLGAAALAAGAGTAIGALPDIIPSRYERDQKKRLKEMQRKQEMGALGLTKAEIDSMQGQMRGTRQQAQQYADAERARLTQPSAQPQMALLGQQMANEGRQRLEADLASQILGMDLSRKAEQEQEIKDLEAAQAQVKRTRFEGAVSPFESASEAYVSQLGLEQLLGSLSPPTDNQPTDNQPIDMQSAISQQLIRQMIENGSGSGSIMSSLGLDPDEQAMLGIATNIPVQMPTGTPSASPSPSPQLSADALFLLEALQKGELDVNNYLGGR